MVLRRLGDLYIILNENTQSPTSHINNWIAIIISICMFIASLYIKKIFNLLYRINELRSQNEARILSAIISTQEKERKFFAKELHDGLGPILSSMKMILSAINKSELTKINYEIINKSEIAIDNAINTTKEISNHLTPQVLERFGLEKAIKTFIDNIIINNSVEFRIESTLKKQRYNYNIEVILYRITCELINNTLKHSLATKGVIIINTYNDKIIYMYEDNGIGFDTSLLNFEGMGLINIKSRVKSLHGKISITSKIEIVAKTLINTYTLIS